MPRAVIAANTVPREGGLGLNFAHMLAALGTEFDVEAICAAPAPPHVTHVVPPPRTLATRLLKLPVLRRLRAWEANLSETAFDRAASHLIGQAQVFQGLTGQCELSLRQARAVGARSLLDVVTVHTDEGDLRVARECPSFGIRFSPNRAQGARRRREYESADRIRVMSHVARRTFLERGFAPERVVTLHPPVETELFPRAQFRHDRFRVTFVGRLEIGKAFHHAIEAFHAARLPDSELVLWGGSGSREVARYLRERVGDDPSIQVRPVAIRKAGLEEVFGKSHVVVHPSVADGFGYVVAEAMASGVPVIASDMTGGSDWIEEGRNGFVVPVGDVNALRDRLVWCHRNASQLPALGQAAWETARMHNLEHFASEYLPVMRELARG